MTEPRGWSPLFADLLARRRALQRRHRLGDGRDHVRLGHAGAAGLRSPVLLRAKGETRARAHRPGRTMLDRAPAVMLRVAGALWTWSAPAATARTHVEHLDDGCAGDRPDPGAPVVKHGNRAASSSVPVPPTCSRSWAWPSTCPLTGVARTVAEVGIGFCFAQVFHAGLRHAGAPRREIGVPTAFNFLGPMTNPARPPAAAIGCSDPRMRRSDGRGARQARRLGARSSAATTGWTS